MAELPDWQPLEQVTAPTSEGDTSGRIVVIVASEGAVAGGWAEKAAVDLASGWAADGRKVMLVDGVLQEPGLHEVAGVPNGEGLSDATLFGASVGRVAQQVPEGGYFLISAGTAVADTNTVVRSPRWHRLSSGFVEAGVTLAVFVRDGDNGTAAFLGSASEIVVLSTAGEEAPGAIRDLEPLVSTVAGLEGAAVAPAPSATPEAEPAAEPAATGSLVEDALSAAALKETASHGRSRMILLGLMVVVLVVVLLGVFGILPIPGLAPTPAEGALLQDSSRGLGLVTG